MFRSFGPFPAKTKTPLVKTNFAQNRPEKAASYSTKGQTAVQRPRAAQHGGFDVSRKKVPAGTEGADERGGVGRRVAANFGRNVGGDFAGSMKA